MTFVLAQLIDIPTLAASCAIQMTGFQKRSRIAQCHRHSPYRWDASCQDQYQVRVQQQSSVGTSSNYNRANDVCVCVATDS